MIRSCKSKDRQCDAFQMVVCPFALFLLYVLLRFTPSDYPFVIIKLFLQNKGFITLKHLGPSIYELSKCAFVIKQHY